jgi:hypothetical protein
VLDCSPSVKFSHKDWGFKVEYKDLRRKFVELSGRYDLINANDTDNGADFFINSGQKKLDKASTVGKMQARNPQAITIGTTIVKTIGLRAVKEVWAGTTADGLIKLAPYTLSEMRQMYEEEFSGVDRGTPIYYCPVAYRPYPDEVTAASLAGYYDIGDLLLTGTHYTYNGVLIMPPPDKTYYVSIDGLFYSPELTATLSGSTWTQTKSFWSEVHPDILIQAALYKLEVFYRNTEGAKDWKFDLDDDLFGMDKDLAEEEAAGISEMGG